MNRLSTTAFLSSFFFLPNVGCPICVTSVNINRPTTVFKEINTVEYCFFLSVSLFPIFPYLINRVFFFIKAHCASVSQNAQVWWEIVCVTQIRKMPLFFDRGHWSLAEMMKNESLLQLYSVWQWFADLTCFVYFMFFKSLLYSYFQWFHHLGFKDKVHASWYANQSLVDPAK